MVSQERDYTGVSLDEMVSVFQRYQDPDCDLRTFAHRIGMNESTLKHKLAGNDGPFVGLGTVDKIVAGLGQSLSSLIESGELTIIPARSSRNSALRMIEDTLVLKATEEIGTIESARMTFEEAVSQGLLVPPSEEEMEQRIEAILRLRGEFALRGCSESDDRLSRDAERSARKEKPAAA